VSREATQTWRLDVEYEGTRYAGWQRQPHARTVQGELVRAAEELWQAKVEVGGAGRTDAGVHALCQVAHLRARRAPKGLTPARLEAGLNALLPHDINVLSARPAPPDFDARRQARARFYLYQIATRRTAFGKPFVWWVKDRLDVTAMSAAAESVEGRHDFRSFCESPEAQASTVVRVETARVAESGDLILFRVGASHFLWKMVRRLVGALVEVGRGRLTPGEFGRLLARHSREPAAWTAPPSGLFLERVLYTGEPPPGPLAPAFPVKRIADFGLRIAE
jgi:tRNA pseudouridine38-40 synthase